MIKEKKCIWFGLMHSNSVENLIAIKPKKSKKEDFKNKVKLAN